jgi:hypothetical protein
MTKKTQLYITLFLLFIVAPILYATWLVPHYKACIKSGTDRGTCVHTWLFRF